MGQERLETAGKASRALRADAWWSAHAARYVHATELLRPGGAVLDVACGTGYGMPVLATVAGTLVGADVDPEAVIEASGAGWSTVTASGTALPFGHAAFDAITSFETIEHLEDRRGFLDELRRVLRPGGALVLSTPNAAHTRDIPGYERNPFHVHEYEPQELRAELLERFDSVELFGQVLAPSFRTPVYQYLQQALPRTPVVQARLLLWRITNKLPYAVQDGIARTVLRRPTFHPGERDHRFDPARLEDAPAVLAVCTAPRTT